MRRLAKCGDIYFEPEYKQYYLYDISKFAVKIVRLKSKGEVALPACCPSCKWMFNECTIAEGESIVLDGSSVRNWSYAFADARIEGSLCIKEFCVTNASYVCQL